MSGQDAYARLALLPPWYRHQSAARSARGNRARDTVTAQWSQRFERAQYKENQGRSPQGWGEVY
jgi:hypothetical protein